MIFSSLQYLIFLPIVALLYWRTKGSARLTLVVLSSYFFYMSWLPVYGILLFLLTCANWLLGQAIDSARQKGSGFSRVFLIAGLVLNLGCLGYYKYTNFLLTNLVALFNSIKLSIPLMSTSIPTWDAPVLHLLLPLGISFFVFEFVHYLVDIYRGDKAIKSWMEFAAFASFFPSQIAGPIKRYQDFMEHLHTPIPWSAALFYQSMALIMKGLFKKVAIADPIGYCVNLGFVSAHALSASDALIASIGFVIQVYCDFSGYTDIGRGSAMLLGIKLPENFRLPYLSHDLADFWRRWHMSLGTWLRDYVYRPLGGSRVGHFNQWRNLFITMVACGLWHGAAWHYVIFGCMQGIGLIVNREWNSFLSWAKPLSRLLNTWAGKQLGTLFTMVFITVSYVIFRAPDMPHALNVLSSLGNWQGECTLSIQILRCGVLQFLAVYAAFWGITELLKVKPNILKLIYSPVYGFDSSVRLAAWTAAIILMIAAKPIEATPFVYFQF